MTAADAAMSGICVVGAAATVTCPLADATSRTCVLSAARDGDRTGYARLQCRGAARCSHRQRDVAREPARAGSTSRSCSRPHPAGRSAALADATQWRISTRSTLTYCVAEPPQPSGDSHLEVERSYVRVTEQCRR